MEIKLFRAVDGVAELLSASGQWVESSAEAHAFTDLGEATNLIRNFAKVGIEVDAIAGYGTAHEETVIFGADMVG